VGYPLLLLIIRLELRRRGRDVMVGNVVVGEAIVRVADRGARVDGNGSVGRVDGPPFMAGGSLSL